MLHKLPIDFISPILAINTNNHRSCLHRFSGVIFKVFFILLFLISKNGTYGMSIRNDSMDNFDDHLTILSTCRLIQDSISNASEVFYPPNEKYFNDIHQHTQSSRSLAICSVEAGTSSDVAIIIQIIGQQRVPFAVKGGGHSTNPNFSSTRGILIAMERIRQIIYHRESQTVDLGAGLLCGDVYRVLEPLNVTVNAGRIGDVGVAGNILGGGYGWKTNQYGLAMNSVLEYELVAPNGAIVRVNNILYPDIFFGLKGGYNNFGIVTNFKMRVVPQTEIYGGILTYTMDSSEKFDKLVNASVNFQNNNKDPKAAIELVFYIKSQMLTVRLLANYDAPTAPEHIFVEFEDIDHIGNLKTLKMADFWNRTFADNIRGRYHSVSSKQMTARLLRKLADLTMYYNSELGSKQGADISFLILHQFPAYLKHSLNSAFNPHVSSSSVFPIGIVVTWELPSDDYIFLKSIQSMADTLLETMIDDGQYDKNVKQIVYPNFALETTPVSSIYGSNLPRLQRIRAAWDPKNVMYLTGGYKI